MVKMKLHQLCTQMGQEQLMQEKNLVTGLEQREPCTQKGQEQLHAPQAALPCLGCEWETLESQEE